MCEKIYTGSGKSAMQHPQIMNIVVFVNGQMMSEQDITDSVLIVEQI